MADVIPFRTAYGPRNRVSFATSGKTKTKQNFKDESDVNNIMKKFERGQLIEHTAKYQGQYGDFLAGGDYHAHMDAIRAADEAFLTLPAEIRSKFHNDPAEFLSFAQDPDNIEALQDLGLANKPPVHDPSVPSGEGTLPGEEPPTTPAPA